MKLTRLGRPIDQEYFPNVLIVVVTIITIASGSVYYVIAGEQVTFVVLYGFAMGIAVFLGWAISREIDPDNDFSAFVQMPFTIWGMLYYGVPNIFVMLFLLHMLRIITRSSGYNATWFESVVWFLLGATLVLIEDYVAGLAMAGAFILDGTLRNPLRRHLYFGVASVIWVAVMVFMKGHFLIMQSISTWEIISAGIITIAFIPVMISSGAPVSMVDTEEEKCDGSRIRASQLLLLLTAIAYMVLVGKEGLQYNYPLWTILLGVSGYWYYKKFFKKTPIDGRA